MRVEKIEVHLLFAKSAELKNIADRMENSFNQCGRFVESIIFNNGFEIEICANSDTTNRTRLDVRNGKFILETNPQELRSVAEKISDKLKNSDIGSNMSAAEYMTSDAVLRIIADQE